MTVSIRQYRRGIRIVLWTAPVVLLVWIINQNIALFGRVTYRCTADTCHAQFKNVAPRQKDILVGTFKGSKERFREYTVDPVSFDIQLPRVMKQATISVTYNSGSVGTRLSLDVVGSVGTSHQTFALGDSSRLIATLEGGWDAVTGNGKTLFQKRDASVKHFSSVDDFLAHVPDRNDVGTYHVTLPSSLKHVVTLKAGSDPKDLSYVIASYVPVVRDGIWMVATQAIPTLPEGRTLHVALTADPPIAGADASLRIKDMSIQLVARPLGFSDFSTALKRVVHGG